MELSIEEKRRKLKMLLQKKQLKNKQEASLEQDYKTYTYDEFLKPIGQEPTEIKNFSHWVELASQDGKYAFESVRTSKQTTEVDLTRETGQTMRLLNFSSYNYLGLGYHPEVIKAAQEAIAKYGLGANSSPVISGTYQVHKELENNIIDFFALPDRGVSLFSSGYAVNLGTIQAYIKPGNYVVCDRAAHMSILEGAILSGGEIKFFNHNDLEDLENILIAICQQTDEPRILICTEGVYSAEGDYGNIAGIVKLAKKYNAATLIDEAHSVLLAGKNGRGVSEMQGVLGEVDLYVMTFSKSFSGVGGALLAKKDIARYVNWYAKCRMFSCALDPGVTGGMVQAVKLAASNEGKIRRQRLQENADYLRGLLQGKVELGHSKTWIITVKFRDESKTLDLNDYLQQQGLDTSIMQFPAVPKNEARIRLFITSEHTKEQLEKAANIIIDAAKKFEFLSDKFVN